MLLLHHPAAISGSAKPVPEAAGTRFAQSQGMKAICLISAGALWLSCSSPPPAPARYPHPAEMGPTMIRHFGPSIAIQNAIVMGDLPAAQHAAQNLLARLGQEQHPIGWEPSLQEVRLATQAVLKAQTVEQGARATADLGYACGKCHDEQGVSFGTPASIFITTPPADLSQAMHRHLAAADDLWMSLLTASDERWRSGAHNLAQADVFPLEAELNTPELRALATRFHALAGAAQQTEWSPARAALYGEILGTCAQCHTTAGRVAVR